ncbi:MAG: hypothetical protein QM760_08230 [Nibricoccus sp.]
MLTASGDITIFDGTQSRAIGLADLSGGPGSGYLNPLVFASTFTLRVTSSGACDLWVRRNDTGPWLSAGELQVQVLRIGDAIDPRPPITIGTSDLKLMESPTALDNQLYELRYQLENFSPQNAPAGYSTQVVFTLTDA